MYWQGFLTNWSRGDQPPIKNKLDQIFDGYYLNAQLEDFDIDYWKNEFYFIVSFESARNLSVEQLGNEIATYIENKTGNFLPIGIGKVNFEKAYKQGGILITDNSEPETLPDEPGPGEKTGDFLGNIFGAVGLNDIPHWTKALMFLVVIAYGLNAWGD